MGSSSGQGLSTKALAPLGAAGDKCGRQGGGLWWHLRCSDFRASESPGERIGSKDLAPWGELRFQSGQ